jgi:hypothetical protein
MMAGIAAVAAMAGAQPVYAVTAASATWKAKTASLPSGAKKHSQYASLQGVACVSSTSCIAVGGYTAGDGSQQGLLLARTGKVWTATEAPIPSSLGGGENVPLAVACAASGECTAIDSFNAGSVILDNTGGSWSASSATPPGGGDLELRAVACWSDGCAAAGTYTPVSGSEEFAIATGSGGSWTTTLIAAPASDPAGSGIQGLVAMSCATSGACEAVGNWSLSPGPGPEDVTSGPIVLTGTGSTWSAAAGALPSNAETYVYADTYPQDRLNDVVCPAAGSGCVAVGRYTDTSDVAQGLILTGSTATEGPLPAGATGISLALDACVSKKSCTIIGEYNTSSVDGDGVLLTGAGTSWTIADAPLTLPGDASATTPNVTPYGLACGSATHCAAVASYVGASTETLLISGAGTSWTAIDPPLPGTSAASPVLGGVACSGKSCIAVGEFYAVTKSNYEPLIESLS